MAAHHPSAEAVASVVRDSAARLIAYLASTTGDLAGAQDAMSEATLSALTSWAERGVPDRPESWLLTAARRNLIDVARRRAVAGRAQVELARALQERAESDVDEVPDRRLHLMFACAHPAIDPTMHAPLILQTVLGLSADRIGEVFLIPGKTMGQRLVRVKAKIKQAGIPFQLPPRDRFAERLTAVLEAVHAAYGLGWDDLDETASDTSDLTQEALRLSRLLVQLLPDEAEAHGLLALHLGVEARRAARRDRHGDFVPLADQDPTVWSTEMIREAEVELVAAQALRRLGPFQLHAAVQSVHNQRAVTGSTNTTAIAALYDGLAAIHPTIGGLVARAAAHRAAFGAQAALDLLDHLARADISAYQPFWVLAAHCRRDLGDAAAARLAARTARSLTNSAAVSRYLLAEFG